jgi:hypothetical protein
MDRDFNLAVSTTGWLSLYPPKPRRSSHILQNSGFCSSGSAGESFDVGLLLESVPVEQEATTKKLPNKSQPKPIRRIILMNLP